MTFNENSKFYCQAKKLLDDFVLKGGNVNDLTKTNPIYKYIANGKAFDESGKILTVDEKFIRLGHARTVSFFDKVKILLDEYIASGKSVEDLSTKDELYKYIKNTRLYDNNGNLVDLETKFAMLGHPRKSRYVKDTREALISAIDEYLKSGGSFHIERKKLPFYKHLESYSNLLRRHGEYLTHEQIIRDDLGYRQFSDLYYRCKGLEELENYIDEDGYIDDIREDKQLSNYVMQLSVDLKIPYYILITLVANQKLRSYTIQLDKIEYTKGLLIRSLVRRKKLTGLKVHDVSTFNALDYLSKYYSDGSEQMFSKKEWLDMFGLGDIEVSFDDKIEKPINIEPIIEDIKKEYPDGYIVMKQLPPKQYRLIIKKAVQMGIRIDELLRTYGLRSKGSSVSRLSRAKMTKIPYFDEMLKRRDELIEQSGVSSKNGFFKEEILVEKIRIVQQVYAEFKERIEHYVPTVEFEEVDEYLTANV